MDSVDALYALDRWADTLEKAQQSKDRVGEALALANIGNIHQSQKNHKSALSYHQQCLAIAREIGNESLELRSMRSVATMLAALGDHAAAVELLGECEERASKASSNDLQLRALTDLVVSLCILGRFPEAERRTKAALEGARQRNSDADEQALSQLLSKLYAEELHQLRELASAYYRANNFTHAVESFRKAAAAARKAGNSDQEEQMLTAASDLLQLNTMKTRQKLWMLVLAVVLGVWCMWFLMRRGRRMPPPPLP